MEATLENARQVQQLMRYTYGLVSIVAGLDKFTNLLTDWKNYIAPSVNIKKNICLFRRWDKPIIDNSIIGNKIFTGDLEV